MSKIIVKTILYVAFYSFFCAISIYAGIKCGFTDSHTPPIPFAIELFTLIVGIVLMIIDIKIAKEGRLIIILVHSLGLLANGLVAGYVIMLAI
ncbi:hypothetical protein KXD93_20395 [Mucilaginibacter sp. BJC16-A38]|uniref:hypothetical protein n=1 Tax=Mucilaginibacter phenanthrenivorans TaxID=1234842 RepID=UPI002157F6DD|nr:hypothetical protein [Mucilaginibacter phenanthrenivorans]MCR8560024.1 hypothetical protein [Mucilaginibacter phenanthrenivorans]